MVGKRFLRKMLPRAWYRHLVDMKTGWVERAAVRSFLTARGAGTAAERRNIIDAVKRVHAHVPCPHLQAEMLPIISAILALPENTEGVVVEAGTFRGGSAAKLSHACAMRRRKLVIFDSFEGIPANDEHHDKNIYGGAVQFDEGDWAGTLETVQDNIHAFGRLDVCMFSKGWFEDTMPGFDMPIDVAYIDVDLASSTRTCLKYLFPRLRPGGVIYSQDGHLPLVIDVLRDDDFWRRDVGVPPPHMEGVGRRKLVAIHRD